jgi:exonuclease III
MSLYCVNRPGIGNNAIVRELCDFAKKFAPSILCIVETQIAKRRVETLARTLGYDTAFAVSSSGRTRGLGILWNNDANVEVFRFS